MEQEEEKSVSIYLKKGSLKVSAIAGRHRLIVDEPEKYGGTAEGPDPYAYLLTALGSCMAMTLRMYADRKKWPLLNIEIILSHKKIYAEDCQHCEKPGAKLDHIFKQIHLEGDLSEEQTERLMDIADKCPVHKTLSAGITITSKTL